MPQSAFIITLVSLFALMFYIRWNWILPLSHYLFMSMQGLIVFMKVILLLTLVLCVLYKSDELSNRC